MIDGFSESGGNESLSYISGLMWTGPGAEGIGGDEMSGMDEIVSEGANGEGANPWGIGGGDPIRKGPCGSIVDEIEVFISRLIREGERALGSALGQSQRPSIIWDV